MDNKITKRRLSDFLAYEWILTLIVAAAVIVAMELIYTVSAVRLSVGQNFKFYYDQNLYTYENPAANLYDLLDVKLGENGKTFSYDVLQVDSETLMSSYNVLTTRLSVQEGDVIFTSLNEEEDGTRRAKTIVDGDGYYVYRMDKLLSDAEEYLANFLKDGETDVYDVENYDEAKIRALFDTRMKGDNRFRTEETKAQGRQDEIARINKLVNEVKDFKRLMDTGEEKGLFFRYTKYEQAAETDGTRDERYITAYEREKTEGRENAVYGFNISALTGGGKDTSAYFKIAGNTDAKDVVLMAFDFLTYQPDLQFETISFINTIVREFSNFLD